MTDSEEDEPVPEQSHVAVGSSTVLHTNLNKEQNMINSQLVNNKTQKEAKEKLMPSVLG